MDVGMAPGNRSGAVRALANLFVRSAACPRQLDTPIHRARGPAKKRTKTARPRRSACPPRRPASRALAMAARSKRRVALSIAEKTPTITNPTTRSSDSEPSPDNSSPPTRKSPYSDSIRQNQLVLPPPTPGTRENHDVFSALAPANLKTTTPFSAIAPENHKTKTSFPLSLQQDQFPILQFPLSLQQIPKPRPLFHSRARKPLPTPFRPRHAPQLLHSKRPQRRHPPQGQRFGISPEMRVDVRVDSAIRRRRLELGRTIGRSRRWRMWAGSSSWMAGEQQT